MNLLAENVRAGLAALSPWEACAVLMAIAYLLLAIRQHIGCWLAAIISTGIYIFLMYEAGLYMESALQVFYMAIAVYGCNSNPFIAIGKEGVNRRVNLNSMTKANLSIGRNGRAYHPQLPSFQINPQRLVEGP